MRHCLTLYRVRIRLGTSIGIRDRRNASHSIICIRMIFCSKLQKPSSFLNICFWSFTCFSSSCFWSIHICLCILYAQLFLPLVHRILLFLHSNPLVYLEVISWKRILLLMHIILLLADGVCRGIFLIIKLDCRGEGTSLYSLVDSFAKYSIICR